jgi:hypothetical protein
MELDTKSIYIAQFPGDKNFQICKCTGSNQGFPLFGIETRKSAESFGRSVAGILGVAFYASKAKDLWSEGKGNPFLLCSITRLRVMKALSGECGLYAEDQSGNHQLLFASSDPDEIGKYASEMSELFNVPVKVDVQSYKSKTNTSESGGKKKMAKSGKVNKTKLCQELLMRGASDKEALYQLTVAHVAEGKSPERAASRAKAFFSYMKAKAKVSSAPVVKKEVKKALVAEPAPVEEIAPVVEEEVPVEEAVQEAEASEDLENTEIEE